MDLRYIGSLAPAVKRLHTMLRARVDPELCWGRFVTETGSELVNRGVRILAHGIALGGEAEEVGSSASMLAMKINFLREKRALVATTFGGLVLMMHAVIIFLLAFIIAVVAGFGGLVEASSITGLGSGQELAIGNALSFDFQNLKVLQMLMIPIAVTLSGINAITAKVTSGGYSHTIYLYLSTTLFGSGMSIVIAPKLASIVFNIGSASP